MSILRLSGTVHVTHHIYDISNMTYISGHISHIMFHVPHIYNHKSQLHIDHHISDIIYLAWHMKEHNYKIKIYT